jgi:DNA-binding winged helix-turn-helix (wHTH) protein/tetratricopeptide (TPR) repeat protein
MSFPPNKLYRFEEFELAPSRRTVTRDGKPLVLSQKAFELLAYLVTNPARVLTKDELLKAVWPNSFVEESNLAQQISALRRALTDRAGCIVTVPGQGYQFTAEVGEESFASQPGQPQSGEFMVHTVRERTRIVVEDSSSADYAPHVALAASRRTRWVPATIVALLLAGIAAWPIWHRFHKPLAGDHHSILLADFENRTGDEVFGPVLKNALEIDLEQSPLLSIVSRSQVRTTLQQMGSPPDAPLTGPVAREVCARSGAQAFLSGSIAALGNTYILTLESTDCVTGKRLALLEARAKGRDAVLSALDDLDSRMRHELGESLHSIQGFDVTIAQETTPSFDALVAYSRGMQVNVRGLLNAESIPFFERAIQLDPKFAMAYEALGAANANIGENEREGEAFEKAYELRQPTSVHEQFLITSRYYEVVQNDPDAAAKNFQLWTASYPLDGVAWASLANTYTQMGRYAEAIQAGRKAVAIQPNSVFGYVVLSRAYKRASQLEQAKNTCQTAQARGLDSWHLHSILFQVAVAEHDEAGMERESSWDKGMPSANQTLDNSAFAAATAGKLQAAERLFDETEEVSKKYQYNDYIEGAETDRAEAETDLGAFTTARATLDRRFAGSRPNSLPGALAAARAGDTRYAKQLLVEELKTPSSPNTLTRKVDIPELQAAIDIQERKPVEALHALEVATDYELRDYVIFSLRGRAYLDAHRGAEAAEEYRKILTNPGIDPVSPLYPLAHLGLARAYAMQNRTQESRKEYEALFALWRDADGDLPVLKQARTEYAHLAVSK